LPAGERLTAQGNQLIRGFKDKLGPYVTLKDKNYFLDGTRRFIQKNELRYKISHSVNCGLFLDAGNTFLPLSDRKKFEEWYEEKKIDTKIKDNFYFFDKISNNYASSGFFVGLITPLGPINLDIAFPVYQPRDPINPEDFLDRRSKSKWVFVFGLSIGNET
jgi:outer membrane protein assembly factor BamA